MKKQYKKLTAVHYGALLLLLVANGCRDLPVAPTKAEVEPMLLLVDEHYLKHGIDNQEYIIVDAHFQRVHSGFWFSSSIAALDVAFYDANRHRLGEDVSGGLIQIPEDFLNRSTDYYHVQGRCVSPGLEAKFFSINLGSLRSPIYQIKRRQETGG